MSIINGKDLPMTQMTFARLTIYVTRGQKRRGSKKHNQFNEDDVTN